MGGQCVGHKWRSSMMIRANYKLSFWLDYLKRLHVDAACLSAGGVTAFYPTDIPLHHRSAWLGSMDSFGEISAGCRNLGMNVIARTDAHACHQDAYDAHPEWIAVDANGAKKKHPSDPTLWITCALGPYNLGCGLRRRELAELAVERLQRREDRWAIVDLIGKGRQIRTVPVPNWVKATLDTWLAAAGIESGPLFRCVCRAGKLWGEGISEKTVWHVVEKTAERMNIPRLAPHDLRRSCARICHAAGGELEQIQFLLGHVSVQTTERYIGCKQRLRVAVNDRLGIEPE
jgi:hypothetical protein